MRTRGKENFTELFLNNLKFEDKFYEIGDAKTPALFIRVNQTKKTFFARKRIEKNIRYLVLGDFPTLSLKDARKKAFDFISDIEESEEQRKAKKLMQISPPSRRSSMKYIYPDTLNE